MSAVLVYSCFREQIPHYYSFIDEVAGIKDKRNKFFKEFKEKAKDVNLTDKKQVKKLIKTKDPYLSVYIYDNKNEYYVAANYADFLTQPVSVITPLYILQTDFETDAYNAVYTKIVQFKDQKAEVELYDMNLLKYIKYYFYVALFASFLTFLLPTFFFIRHKVKYIECLKQEILNMSQGDLSHPMTIQGRDELAVLAHQMDGLRVTLQENNEKEMEMQQTHHDLITAMSHDLRTPLTSLRGYLDILALHCFKDQEQMDNYLHRCIDKVEQIKELSNKTFAYSLVFEQNSHPKLESMSTEALLSYIEENLNYLELEGFIIDRNYLLHLQSANRNCTGAFCGYGVAVTDFRHPVIDFNRNNTYIQSEGITENFGVYDSPDKLLEAHCQEMSALKAFAYRNLGRHLMNRNVRKIRKL